MKQLDNHHALLIGVGYEQKDVYMRHDAKAVYEVLVDENYAGYKPENVKLLIGEDATREKIRGSLDDLARRTNSDSKVLIYYSGHGNGFTRDGVNMYYLELYGYYDYGDDDYNIKPRLDAHEIREHLNKISADRLTFLFDCCHAQGMTKGGELLTTANKLDVNHKWGKSDAVKEENMKSEQMVQLLDDEEGFAIISSCKDHQKSLRHNEHTNSLFTTCLIEALKGENIYNPKDPFVRLTDVVNYLSEEVPKRAQEWKRKQDPFFNLSFDDNFELCKVPRNKIAERLLIEFEKMDIKPAPSKTKRAVKKYFRKSEGVNNVLILAHGFTGEGHETYGKIPYLLMGNEKMNGWDIMPFGINQNITPAMGKGVWASIENLNRYSENLRSRLANEFNSYDRIAIVAYSLGGLAVQKAILASEPEIRERLSHVILIATPSNGITNDAFKEHWKNQIHDLIKGSSYINNLRSEWDQTFKDNYPFHLKVVAATKDEYVSKESCLDPFGQKYWEMVSGNHLSVVKQETNENDTYRLILDTLTNNAFSRLYTDQEEVNLLLGEYDRIIDELMPDLEKLNEGALEKLIHALEGSGKRQEAIKILKTHKLTQEDSDMLRALGDLYKNRYLNDSHLEDAETAMNCYKRSYEIAKNEKDNEDVYLSAIDLAFLNLLLDNKKDMLAYAEEARDLAEHMRNSLNKLCTMAEAFLLQDDMDKARSYYEKTAALAGIKEKIAIYSNAFTAYSKLSGVDDPADEFILFLKENLLT
ncbi:MAG: caspase family protein [Bacteroidia bacterium]|nr:caspase family protein [Bacteroidia bacterium]